MVVYENRKLISTMEVEEAAGDSGRQPKAEADL